ncbi:MAG: hypothetical protein MN733_17100 [Nitrososphaera sp.]|nr:hypothetical protein [Nitrososphaera sp.]
MTEPDQKIFDFLPKPAKRLPFRLLKVEDVYLPHPYCLTPKHLKYADSIVLDEASIAKAEAEGAKCDTCRRLYKAGRQDEILPLSKHEKQKALFIEVEDNRDLNQIKGLHKYLWKIRPLAETLGVQGFAFPKRKPDL